MATPKQAVSVAAKASPIVCFNLLPFGPRYGLPRQLLVAPPQLVSAVHGEFPRPDPFESYTICVQAWVAAPTI
jgi:hypothetical protein